jgi:hypothetical protein
LKDIKICDDRIILFAGTKRITQLITLAVSIKINFLDSKCICDDLFVKWNNSASV